MGIIHANESNFTQLINADIVLVDFFANWCGPCKMLTPVLEALASNHSSIKIVKVNVDECESLARSYGIMSIPTLLLFKQGKLISTKTGFMPEQELRDWIEKEK